MPKIVWDVVGSRKGETGVSKGLLFVLGTGGVYGAGVPWNGLTTVTESSSGAELSPIYSDNIKYLNLMSAEEWEGSIEAFMYPDEFAKCDGSADIATGVSIGQQERAQFAFCWQTKIITDSNPAAGYKIHIVYGCTASPSERAHATVNDSPELMAFSWDVKSTPVDVTGYKPSATVVIDSTKVDATKLADLEKKLYGGTEVGENSGLLLPDAIAALVGAAG